jgi:long-chain fatty acid transport protein
MPASVWATNGYFSYGWGTKSKAMAGVATALPQDALVAASNPAGMAFLGRRLDLGLAIFNPSPRGYEANGDYSAQSIPATDGANNFSVEFPTGGFVRPGRYDSSNDWFVIPSIGYNHPLNDRSTIGFSLYGNGGMNTDYDHAVWANFAPAPNQQAVDGQLVFATLPLATNTQEGGRVLIQNGQPVPVTQPVPGGQNANPGGFLTAFAPTGVKLEQLFIELPYTIKFADQSQAFGIAPVFAVQGFEAKGLQPFRAASLRPEKVSNNGVDWSYGFGLHLGWYGEITDRMALGMSYRTQMWMSDFDEYSGLFANQGHFNIPAMFNFGLAFKARPDVTLAFDYQHIFYDEIDAISNSNDIDLEPCFGVVPKPSYCLGGDSGLGFGWKSMDIIKVGVRWDQSEKWKFFGGASYNTELLKTSQQALFNILTPATIRWHLTVGATYVHGANNEFNLSYAYMPKENIDGTSPAITQDQSGNFYMQQQEVEISWNRRF